MCVCNDFADVDRSGSIYKELMNEGTLPIPTWAMTGKNKFHIYIYICIYLCVYLYFADVDRSGSIYKELISQGTLLIRAVTS